MTETRYHFEGTGSPVNNYSLKKRYEISNKVYILRRNSNRVRY